MPGKQLSPWTLAWFGAAMLFLLLSLATAMSGAVGPGDWSRGAGFAAVHLFTLGWLCLMVMGALVQFVPVLTAQPLARPRLALPALLLGAAGTLALAAGFLWLDGHEAMRPFLRAAPVLLALSFGLTAAMIAPPLLARASRALSEVRMVLLALVALAALWISGTAMALQLGGVDRMPDILPEGLPLHVLIGIGGWLSLAAFGVSYKLFAMFLLAPEQTGPVRRAVFGAAWLALVAMLGAGAALLAGYPVGAWVFAALAVLLPIAAGFYLAEVARIWRLRRRPKPEGNMLWSRAALMFLALASILAGPGLWQGGVWAEAAIFVALAGWLSLLTLAQIIKITSFLTWIQIFAPRIGRSPVPQVQQLTDPRTDTLCLMLWSGGVAAATLSLLLSWPSVFRLSVAALFLAALAVAVELVRIRRLSHLDPSLRPASLPPVIRPVPVPVPQPEIRT